MYLGRRPHLWLNLILISLLTFGLRTEFDSSVHHCGYPKTKNLDINETTNIAKLALSDLESEGRTVVKHCLPTTNICKLYSGFYSVDFLILLESTIIISVLCFPCTCPLIQSI